MCWCVYGITCACMFVVVPVCCTWACMCAWILFGTDFHCSICLRYCLWYWALVSMISLWTQNSYPLLPLYLLSMMTPINFHNHPFTLLYYRPSIFTSLQRCILISLLSPSSLRKIASIQSCAKPAQTWVQFFYMNISFTFFKSWSYGWQDSCKHCWRKVRTGIWTNLWSFQTSKWAILKSKREIIIYLSYIVNRKACNAFKT